MWSHLLGALLFIAMGFYVAANMHPDVPIVSSVDVCPAIGNQCAVDSYFKLGDTVHSNPTIFHSFYNHHVEAFERIEETVRVAIKATEGVLRDCVPCATHLV